MACIRSYGILLIILTLGSVLSLVTSVDDFSHCENVVRKWADYSNENGTKKADLTLKDLLFFLHVPRTGGRTYFHCFLRKLYRSDQECPRSYDKLHFDPSKPNCRLVVTHDDYSLMSRLPKDRTSVVTILRDPVDRVFSAYEFSIEVAARFLVHPNLTSAIQMSRQIRKKSSSVSTLDIWPWKYLVQWMRQDLFDRVYHRHPHAQSSPLLTFDASFLQFDLDLLNSLTRSVIQRDRRKLVRIGKTEVRNPYDMEDMTMPLHEFINDPIAHDIIHNGATFQVAGLTNNSYTMESHEVRNCVRKHPELGQFVLEVAKHRVNNMLYVGLTEEHKMSATMFAKLVGAQVLSQSDDLNSEFEQATSNKTESDASTSDLETNELNSFEDNMNHTKESEDASLTHSDLERKNVTVGKLMGIYEKCISNLRKSQASRRTMSLNRISPVNFSKQARQSISMETLQQIRNLNSLDVELYQHAKSVFMQQLEHLTQNTEDALALSSGDLIAEMELRKAGCGSFYGCSHWRFFLAVSFIMIFALIILFVGRRRTNKLKI